MRTIEELLEGNRAWSERLKKNDPDFFQRLKKTQRPDILWIGCSDSRITPTASVSVLPGEMFVHRNVANLVIHSDMNCLSAIQFAVDVLKVRLIIVCGHYGCGGVKAAFDDSRFGIVDNWLRHIKDTMHRYKDELSELPDDDARMDKICELNVIEQVVNVGETTIVQDAWERGQELSVHGWIYTVSNGIYRDMNVAANGLSSLEELATSTFTERYSICAAGKF